MQLKAGCQIPSPCELKGKILIKNKKSGNETQTSTKKAQDPASTTASAQETPGGAGEAQWQFCVFNVFMSSCFPVEPEEGARVEETEDTEDTEEQDEEKMKTSDEVECASHHLSVVLHP